VTRDTAAADRAAHDLRDNRDSLVTVTARAFVAPVRVLPELTFPDRDGRSRILPGNGGISIGVHVGDLVGSAATADHLMPGACLESEPASPAAVGDVHLLSCLGNSVFDSAGRPIGVVAGKRGGLAPGFWAPTHLSVDLFESAEASLAPGDSVAVRTRGRGLILTDQPAVQVFNCDPELLDHIGLTVRGHRIEVPVRAVVHAGWAAAGLGQDPWIGDLEVGDIDQLPSGVRFGDLIAFADLDAAADRSYHSGYIAVGAVSHGPSARPGHGVGVTILIGGPAAQLGAVLDNTASASIAPGLARIAHTLAKRHSATGDSQETT
jgi:hypothetical protein